MVDESMEEFKRKMKQEGKPVYIAKPTLTFYENSTEFMEAVKELDKVKYE